MEVAHHPGILRALSPSYGVQFFAEHGGVAFIALASVVLAVTGAEALYADMGHFGRPPIRRAWFLIVFPALTLNYLAQGALILRSPQAISEPLLPACPRAGRRYRWWCSRPPRRHRLAGGDLGCLQRDPAGRAARLSAAALRSAIPPSGRSGRSTCPRSTARCSWPCWRSRSVSGPPRRSRPPTASRSPAHSSSTRSCSSRSRGCSGAGRECRSRSAPWCSSRSRSRSSRRTSRRSCTADGCRS